MTLACRNEKKNKYKVTYYARICEYINTNQVILLFQVLNNQCKMKQMHIFLFFMKIWNWKLKKKKKWKESYYSKLNIYHNYIKCKYMITIASETQRM